MKEGKHIYIYKDINPNSPTFGLQRQMAVPNADDCRVDDSPQWELDMTSCILVDGLQNGAVEYRYSDVNPHSSTYLSTSSVTVYNDELCEVESTEPYWDVISEHCETILYPNFNEYGNTGYHITTYEDKNPLSNTSESDRVYSTRIYDSDKCPILTAPNWVTINEECEVNTFGQNTGTHIITQIDINPYSPTYNNERIQTEVSFIKCPPINNQLSYNLNITYLEGLTAEMVPRYEVDGTSYPLPQLTINNVTRIRGNIPSRGWIKGIENNKLDSVDAFPLEATPCENLFFGATSCKSFIFSDIDTSNATSMTNMFNGCFATDLVISGLSQFNTSNVADMSSMFASCSLNDNILNDILGWDTSNVTMFENMFYGTPNLTNINLSEWSTDSARILRGMFQYSFNCTNINLSGWDTSNVTDVSYMFAGCSSLASLDLGGWNLNNCTNYTKMFNGCSALQFIYATNVSHTTFQILAFSKPSQCSIIL